MPKFEQYDNHNQTKLEKQSIHFLFYARTIVVLLYLSDFCNTLLLIRPYFNDDWYRVLSTSTVLESVQEVRADCMENDSRVYGMCTHMDYVLSKE